ncbi:poly(R)-hydroxyalkanoic acid synthase subunit PhaE [Romboutsia sp.]|uniref:poly(R)-hydroxyalkanoic acid synthase subunit PhaE n=1 Tax=Romboutsia sp. TaxID=1965302 RepID=UPI002C764CBC|nr:poly(R)-hydroxyalkanoic acid synthase subunit PhaE [Romboutsia sp.]HSQ87365.1 poly(R)-hydroxyalkanoic acid synthase subunit PhaE [Romboutsia sp.]
MDLQQKYFDFLGDMANTQKKIFEDWQNSFKVEDKKDKFDYLEMWSKFNPFNQKMDNVDLVDKYSDISKIYTGLYGFWTDMNEKIVDSTEDQMKNLIDEWKENYTNMVVNNFISCLPEPTKSIYKKQNEIWSVYKGDFDRISKLCIDSYNDYFKYMNKAVSGDKNAYLELSKSWTSTYEETIGKLLNIPLIGINREEYKLQFESMDTYYKFINTLNEYNASIYKVTVDTMEEMVKEYTSMVKEDKQPKTFKEFYEYWWVKNENAFISLFNTEHYSKLQGQVVDNGMAFKKSLDSLLEKQLEALPIPNQSDMNSLYKTVYELKKEVKKLKREVEDLKEEMK